MAIFFPVLVVACVGLFFGIVLGIASKKLAVISDPKISEIANALPNANCGACGYPGCSAFAKEVASGSASPAGCIPGGSKTASLIASVLGIEENTSEAFIAVVHCKGGNNEAKTRAIYDGIIDCNAAILIGNGSKTCLDGCLGLGTCVAACPFDALKISNNGIAVVDPKKCTGCGKCVSACPRNIIELIPKVHKIFIACNSHERGAKIKKQICSVGCTACALCVKVTPSGAITMENNIPRLDYTRGENFITASNKCPSKSFIDMVKVRPKANIDTKCDGCGKCVDVCPIKGAIEGKLGDRHTIIKNKCIGCGICLSSCDLHAISLWGGLGYSPDDKSMRQRSN